MTSLPREIRDWDWPRLVPPLVALAVLLLAAGSLAPGLTAGDAGELLAAAHGLGVAHAPGYPLYLPLVQLAEALGGAWGANLLSVLALALAAGLAARLVIRLTGSLGGGVTTALLLALGGLFWRGALAAEVYPLALLLQLAALSAVVAWRESAVAGGKEQPTADGRRAGVCGLACGLALAHHPGALFLLPALLLLVPWRRLGLRSVVLFIAAFLLALSVLLYLPLRAAAGAAVSWGPADRWKGFLSQLSGAEYGTAFFSLPAAAYGQRLGQLALTAAANWGWPLLAAAVLLTAVAAWKRTRLTVALVLWLLTGLLLTAGYAKPDVTAYLLGPLAGLALAAGLGWSVLEGRLHDRERRWAVPGAAVLLAGGLLISVPPLDRAADRLAEDTARDVLATIPAEGVLIPRSDEPFGALALQMTADRRPDARLLFSFLREQQIAGEPPEELILKLSAAGVPLVSLLPEVLPDRSPYPVGLGYRLLAADVPPPPSLENRLRRPAGPLGDLAARNLALVGQLSRLSRWLLVESPLYPPQETAARLVGGIAAARLQAGEEWQPWSRLAEGLDFLGLSRPALTAYRYSLVNNPADPALLFNAGALAAELGGLDEAAACFTAAREGEGPAAASAGAALAQLQEQRGFLAEAERAWDWLTERYPDDPQAHFQRGNYLLHQGRPEDAAAAYERVLELDPRHVGALVNLAQIRLANADPATAEQLLRQAEGIAPANAEVQFSLGQLARTRRDFLTAAEYYRRAYELDATKGPALLLAAICLHEAGHLSAAAELYQRCLAVMPDEPEVYYYFAQLVELYPEGHSDAIILYSEYLRLAGESVPPEQAAFVRERLAALQG